ncbi:hypothetical protein GEV33_001606 [Tenebrio molitor]|uniref:Uncharacterized protein n=1 Tax=Tenebrio molitor TaxID=7067 RepID=A0A8J6HLY9_TENMO|nr:hypothetical protein GEV33_001606 [Tenebrio molitor]
MHRSYVCLIKGCEVIPVPRLTRWHWRSSSAETAGRRAVHPKLHTGAVAEHATQPRNVAL